jgi:hypothetical protein
MDLNIRLLA